MPSGSSIIDLPNPVEAYPSSAPSLQFDGGVALQFNGGVATASTTLVSNADIVVTGTPQNLPSPPNASIPLYPESRRDRHYSEHLSETSLGSDGSPKTAAHLSEDVFTSEAGFKPVSMVGAVLESKHEKGKRLRARTQQESFTKEGSIVCSCGRLFANGQALGGHRGKCKIPRDRKKTNERALSGRERGQSDDDVLEEPSTPSPERDTLDFIPSRGNIKKDPTENSGKPADGRGKKDARGNPENVRTGSYEDVFGAGDGVGSDGHKSRQVSKTDPGYGLKPGEEAGIPGLVFDLPRYGLVY